MSKIKVTQIRSTIGQPEDQKRVIFSMGLRKLGATKEFKDTNCIRGMINKV